jgi:hypothetical protein
MADFESALSELGAALAATDTKLSTSLAEILGVAIQELIEAELAALIGATRTAPSTPSLLDQHRALRGPSRARVPACPTSSFSTGTSSPPASSTSPSGADGRAAPGVARSIACRTLRRGGCRRASARRMGRSNGPSCAGPTSHDGAATRGLRRRATLDQRAPGPAQASLTSGSAQDHPCRVPKEQPSRCPPTAPDAPSPPSPPSS